MNAQSITINQLEMIIGFYKVLGIDHKREEFMSLTYDEAEKKLDDLESYLRDKIDDYNYRAYRESLLDEDE